MGLTKTQSGGLEDQSVTLDKLPHGTGSNDGKFLRANNGADPTFETVSGTTINNNADNRVITGSGTANTLEGESVLTFDSSTDTLQIHQQNNSNNPALKVLHRGGASSNISAHFQTYGGTNDVVITHGGQLGIGTTSPGDKLHVNGTTNLAGNSYLTNAFVSGNIYLGGTGSANALDDYEEGTWTPTAHGYTASNTSNNCFYTKIGRLVIATFRMTWPSLTNSASAEIRGLPFTARSQAVNTHGGAFAETNDNDNLSMIVQQNTTKMYILRCTSSGVDTQTVTEVSGKDFRGNVIYFTDA